jgi:hypothetical protein
LMRPMRPTHGNRTRRRLGNTRMNDQKSYDQLNAEARHKLTELACKMQFLLDPGDVAKIRH